MVFKEKWVYEVDCRDHVEMWSSRAVEEFYQTEISHDINDGGWATFDDWFYDMQRNGLIKEVA